MKLGFIEKKDGHHHFNFFSSMVRELSTWKKLGSIFKVLACAGNKGHTISTSDITLN